MKFSVGEIAMYVGPTVSLYSENVRVDSVGPFKKGDSVPGRFPYVFAECADYVISLSDGTFMSVDEWTLRKLPGHRTGSEICRDIIRKAPAPKEVSYE